MSKARTYLKSTAIALAGGALITGLLYAVEHVNLTGRKPITVDLRALSANDARKPLLARFDPIKFGCDKEKSDLGKTICWAEIESFNGVPARYLAFFFDGDNRLTALKVAAYAGEYEALVKTFDKEFGAPEKPANAPLLTWLTPGGVLSMSANPPDGQEATVLWVGKPEVVEEIRRDAADR